MVKQNVKNLKTATPLMQGSVLTTLRLAPPLLKNIRLGWKTLSMTNAQALFKDTYIIELQS
jgi:hypothetical protein